MNVTQEPRRYDVFLSSAVRGLEEIREDLGDWLEKSGYDAFVFARLKDQTDWKALLPAAREGICLEHVRRSRFYVGIFHSTYGSSALDHAADIAFTDLELFEAFRSRVPVRLYLLAAAALDSKLLALLMLVRAIAPGAFVECASVADLHERIHRDINSHFAKVTPPSLPPSTFTSYQQRLIVARKPDDDRDVGLRFLLDRYPPPSLPFDLDLVREELRQVRSLDSYEARLNGTWRVLQRLFEVPWMRTHEHLGLWDEAFGVWETAAAWNGLHGFTYAGRLAAVLTLVAIRALIASRGESDSLADLLRNGSTRTGTREAWISLYALGGAIASEYYSIAKQAPDSQLRTHYLLKADSWIDVAQRTYAMGRSAKREAGLSSIRGHILYELGKPSEAIGLLERSLQLREDGGLGPGSVGEAKVDLGYVYYATGRQRQGERLMHDGLDELERHGSPAFLGRAKEKVGRAYMSGWHFKKGLRRLVEVKALAEKHSLNDQLRGVRWLARIPGWLMKLLSRVL